MYGVPGDAEGFPRFREGEVHIQIRCGGKLPGRSPHRSRAFVSGARRRRAEVDVTLPLVDGDGELAAGGVLADDPDRVARHIDAAVNPDEVGERCSCPHSLSHRPVVGEHRVAPGSWLGGVYVVRIVRAASSPTGFQMPLCTMRRSWRPS